MKSVLIVDDDRTLCESFACYLQNKGYETFIEENGKSALELLNRQRIDIIIVDIYLPGMNGIELLKMIKTKSPESAVIMITGFPEVDKAIDIVKERAFSYMYKPISGQQLLSCINEASEFIDSVELKNKIEKDNNHYLKLLENKLHKCQQYNNNLIKNNNELIIIINPAKQLLFINEFGIKLINIEDKSLILGSDIWNLLFKKSSIENANECYQSALDGIAKSFQGELKIGAIQSRNYWTIHMAPIYDVHKNIDQILIFTGNS